MVASGGGSRLNEIVSLEWPFDSLNAYKELITISSDSRVLFMSMAYYLSLL